MSEGGHVSPFSLNTQSPEDERGDVADDEHERSPTAGHVDGLFLTFDRFEHIRGRSLWRNHPQPFFYMG